MTSIGRYTIVSLSEGVWDIGDSGGNSSGIPTVDAYLVAGTQKAIVIDAGVSQGDLAAVVRGITSLPAEVLLLHAHDDHTGGCDSFDTVHMSPLEMEMCEDREFSGACFDYTRTLPVWPGDVFDLGGRRLEILDMKGHTPGSLVALDRENQLLFTSDSLGSGPIWMHIPYTLNLEIFLENLKRLQEAVRDMPDLVLHTGHMRQHTEPLGQRYLSDVRSLTEDLLSGKIVGDPLPPNDPWPGYCACRGQMTGFCYDPAKLT